MSKKHPVKFVDLNFNRWANPSKELVIARKGKRSIRYYGPTPKSLARVVRLCRNSNVGRTYPFDNGWIWMVED